MAGRRPDRRGQGGRGQLIVDVSTTDLTTLVQSFELLRNAVYIIGAVSGAAVALIGVVLRANYVPRAEIEAKLHGVRNAVSNGDTALSVKFEAIDRVHAAEIDALKETGARHESRLERGEERFLALDSRIGQLPTEKSISDLALQLERVSGDVRVAIEQVGGVREAQKSAERGFVRIDEYLRKKELQGS